MEVPAEKESRCEMLMLVLSVVGSGGISDLSVVRDPQLRRFPA